MSIINLDTIKRKEIIPGYEARFVHAENVTLAFWDVKAGSILPNHSHIHEQLVQVIEGTFELTIANETHTLTEGKVAIIPSNTEHSGKAITDCKLVDTFYPVREDYL